MAVIDNVYNSYTTPNLLRHLAKKLDSIADAERRLTAARISGKMKKSEAYSRGIVTEYAKTLALADVLTERFAGNGVNGAVAFNFLALNHPNS